MTVRFLLDTSIVSEPVAKEPNPEVVRRLEEHGAECAIASVVWHELLFGCYRLPVSRRRTMLEAYLRDVVRPTFQVLNYDEAAAGWHAAERVRLESIGRPAPFVDGQIAAIAASNELVLVTANSKDFAFYKDLAVQDWKRRKRGH